MRYFAFICFSNIHNLSRLSIVYSNRFVWFLLHTSQFFKILLVMCLVGFVCKVILTWEVVKLIFFCSERELGVYKLGEMYPEWKPVYLHAKRKSKIYSMCTQFLLIFALIRAVYFNCWKDAVQKKFPFTYFMVFQLTGF